ncbi:DUF3098 domain-containing protein [Salinibacter sp. 10B]|uniref:DUF3098 domain-containing protein n=1 Tax=Salinibacter sp. 10B TaxID=1923971 RepID=UPI0015E48804|nr:DUF3098 domain-containing protein [Salinibacter sp. 10B]
MPKSSKRTSGPGRSALIFRKQNYVLLAVSVLLIAVGFVAMYLDGQFLGFVSLTVSPIIILSGYALLVYAILRRPDESPQPVEEA